MLANAPSRHSMTHQSMRVSKWKMASTFALTSFCNLEHSPVSKETGLIPNCCCCISMRTHKSRPGFQLSFLSGKSYCTLLRSPRIGARSIRVGIYREHGRSQSYSKHCQASVASCKSQSKTVNWDGWGLPSRWDWPLGSEIGQPEFSSSSSRSSDMRLIPW